MTLPDDVNELYLDESLPLHYVAILSFFPEKRQRSMMSSCFALIGILWKWPEIDFMPQFH